ncbi:hypothetical protein PanWU01x14_009960 [Parasponia andersonii]|uniref:Uncharacterized protein n=1 Tax=Parasponia andersonii TaxID=3476 RepID=A0A2P5E2J9_PARAD|nr:hypothetical protein PanWU01x14_009960 [Parasponia andersonii]
MKYCFACIYDSETATKLILKIEQTLRRLYAFYNVSESAQNVGVEKGESSTPPAPKAQRTLENRKLLSQFLKQQQENFGIEKINDVDRYLADDIVNPMSSSFDILSRWK